MASDYVAGGVPERLVPHTTEARGTGETPVVAGRRRGPSVAFWGMAMLIASEATLFGTFIGSYYYLRFSSPHWPPPGTSEPRVVVPLITDPGTARAMDLQLPESFLTRADEVIE